MATSEGGWEFMFMMIHLQIAFSASYPSNVSTVLDSLNTIDL